MWAVHAFCLLSPGLPCSPWGAVEQQRRAEPEPPLFAFWGSAWAQYRSFSGVCSQVEFLELVCSCCLVRLPFSIEEPVALPPTCMKLLEALAWLPLGPASPHTALLLPELWQQGRAGDLQATPTGGCVVAGGGDRAGCGCSTPRSLWFSGPAQQTPKADWSSASTWSPPGAAGASPRSEQRCASPRPQQPARCCRWTRRWSPTRCRKRTSARACSSGERPPAVIRGSHGTLRCPRLSERSVEPPNPGLFPSAPWEGGARLGKEVGSRGGEGTPWLGGGGTGSLCLAAGSPSRAREQEEGRLPRGNHSPVGKCPEHPASTLTGFSWTAQEFPLLNWSVTPPPPTPVLSPKQAAYEQLPLSN